MRPEGLRAAAGRLAPRGGAARAIGSLWSAQAAGLAIAAVQGILVARWLGPEGLGVAALVVSYAGILYTFLDSRSADATMRYLGGFAARGEHARALGTAKLAYALDATVSLVALGLVTASAGWAAAHLVDGRAPRWLFVAMALGFVARSPVATSQSILATLDRFGLVARLQAIAAAARATLVLGAVGAGAGPRGVVVVSAVGFALEGAAFAVVAARVSHRAWGGPWLGARVADIGEERRGLVRFLAWTNLGSLVGLLGKEADALVLGLARGATDVGYYRFARSAAAVAGSLVGPLQSVAYRRFAALHGAGDREGIGRAARRASMRAAIPLGLLMLAALPFVPFAVRLVGGDAYRPAAGAAQVLLVGAALWMCFFWIRPLLLTLGDVREVAVANAVAALLAFAGYLAFAGGFGATGVAAAQTAAAAAGWLLLVRHLARRHEGLLGGRAVGPSEVRDAFLP